MSVTAVADAVDAKTITATVTRGGTP